VNAIFSAVFVERFSVITSALGIPGWVRASSSRHASASGFLRSVVPAPNPPVKMIRFARSFTYNSPQNDASVTSNVPKPITASHVVAGHVATADRDAKIARAAERVVAEGGECTDRNCDASGWSAHASAKSRVVQKVEHLPRLLWERRRLGMSVTRCSRARSLGGVSGWGAWATLQLLLAIWRA